MHLGITRNHVSDQYKLYQEAYAMLHQTSLHCVADVAQLMMHLTARRCGYQGVSHKQSPSNQMIL